MMRSSIIGVIGVLLAVPRLAPAAVCAPAGPYTEIDAATAPDGGCITVAAGDTAVLVGDSSRLAGLRIKGTLVFDCVDLELTADRIEVAAGGLLQIGTPTTPHTSRAKITLTAEHPPPACTTDTEPLSLEVVGGTLELHGEPRGVSWTRLERVAGGGIQAHLEVEEPVPSWRSGDRIIIASTDYDMLRFDDPSIVGLAAGGSVITVAAPIWPHYSGTAYPSSPHGGVVMKAEIGLLTRNILVTSEPLNCAVRDSPDGAESCDGGHLRFLSAGASPPQVRISWAAFSRLGQYLHKGRYPLHFHEAGDLPPGTSYLRHNSLFRNYFRGIVIHSTNDLEVTGNVLFDTWGHGFYLEEHAEERNLLDRNLGLVVRALPEADAELALCAEGAEYCFDSLDEITDLKPGVFYISHPNNSVIRNSAAGSAAYGFYLNPVGGEAATGLIFRDNVAHSSDDIGLFQDSNPFPDCPLTFDPDGWPNEACITLEHFTAYKNRRYGYWYRSWGSVRMTGFKLADNGSGTYPASGGWQLKDSWITLDHSTIVGDSDNVGTPIEPCELDAGRSLAFIGSYVYPDEPHAPLIGFEIYDGLLKVEHVAFQGFGDLTICGDVRPAGAFGPTSLGRRWAIHPRNHARWITLAPGVRPAFFRPTDPEVGGVASTILWARDASVTGTADDWLMTDYWDLSRPPDYPPGHPLAGTPVFPYAEYPGGNALVVEAGPSYGQLHLEDLADLMTYVTITRMDGATERPRAPFNDPGHFAATVLTGEAAPGVPFVYTLTLEPADTMERFDLMLRMGDPGASIGVIVPYPYPTPTVRVRSQVPASVWPAVTVANDPAAVWTTPGPAAFHDGTDLYLKLEVANSGAILDRRELELRVEP